MSLQEERPRHDRVAVQQIVDLTASTCTGDRGALTEDISLGGVLVRTNSCVAEGSEVSLLVAYPRRLLELLKSMSSAGVEFCVVRNMEQGQWLRLSSAITSRCRNSWRRLLDTLDRLLGFYALAPDHQP
jgi:hypothetical protein